MRLAFVLAVVGYGTKVGLFPVHTWLPDAHAEAPTPVSALLSGSLLAVSFYAILRFYQVAAASRSARISRRPCCSCSASLSLLLAALYVLDQRDVKRLLAYSSVEHMGILAIGVSFGAPLAFAGVLLHVLAHAAAKGNAFMGAGVLVRKYGTKELGLHPRRVRPAALVGAVVPACDLRAVRDAAVRDLPQRVPDRRRRVRQRSTTPRPCAGRAGHLGVPRADRIDDAHSVPARHGRRGGRAGRAERVDGRAGRWPVSRCCSCSGWRRRAHLVDLLARGAAELRGGA